MPNYVTNRVQMKGIADEDCLYSKRNIDDDIAGDFDFNRLVRFPAELYYTTSPSCIDDVFNDMNISPIEIDALYNKLKADYSIIPDKIIDKHKYEFIRDSLSCSFTLKDVYKDKPIEEVKKIAARVICNYIHCIKEYGCTNWYDWRLKNWGTKWNAMDTFLVDDDIIEFNTAWDAPIPIFKALSKKFPNKEIITDSADEGANFVIGTKLLNGNIQIKYCYAASMDEPKEEAVKREKIASDILGIDMSWTNVIKEGEKYGEKCEN